MFQVLGYLKVVEDILVSLTKLAGTLLFGLAVGRLILEIFRKNQHAWQVQIAFFLGIIALLIAFLVYSPLGLGGFCIGAGAAIIKWGFPKAENDKQD